MCSSRLHCVALVLLVACGLAWGFETVAAQGPNDLRPGSRVRLMLPNETDWIVGSVLDVTPASLRVLKARSDTLDIVWDRINRLEISQGRRSHVVTGIIVGGAAGGVVGLGYGFAALTFGNLFTLGGIDGGKVIAFSAAVLAGGAVVGGTIGALIRTDRWTAAHVAGRVVTLSAGPGSIVLRFQ